MSRRVRTGTAKFPPPTWNDICAPAGPAMMRPAAQTAPPRLLRNADHRDTECSLNGVVVAGIDHDIADAVEVGEGALREADITRDNTVGGNHIIGAQGRHR